MKLKVINIDGKKTNDIEISNKPRIIITSNWLHNFIITLEVSNPLANWDNLIELYQDLSVYVVVS